MSEAEIPLNIFTTVGLRWLVTFPPRIREEFEHPPLHHYTSPEGLVGIVASHELWASRARFSNDLSEVAYALTIVLDVIRERQDRKDIHESERELLTDLLGRYSTANRPFYDGYIVSFCENPNLLSQWRTYLTKGGFSLTFHPLADHGHLTLKSESAVKTVLRRVDYIPESQRKSLVNVLDKVSGLYAELRDQEIGPADELRLVVSTMTEMAINEWIYTVKHKAFSEEAEWRLISFPKMKADLFGTEYASFTSLSTRVIGGRLVPYMKIASTRDDKLLPITEMMCGPGSDVERTGEAATFLLTSNGYRDVKVSDSGIPVFV